MPGRFYSVAQRPMCQLANLLNPFKNLFAFPFVYRHPEGLPAVRGLNERYHQVAANVCLWLWFLRRFQDLEHLSGVGGRLEAGKKQVYVGFIGEEHLARSLILQSGFKGMKTSGLDLEWIRDKLVLAEGVPHRRVGKFNEDAILDGGSDHLPLPIVASCAGDARSVFLDGHLQAKDYCGLVLIEHGHAPPVVDDGQLPIHRVRDIPSGPVNRPYPGCGNLSCEVLRPLLSSEPLFDELGPIPLLFIRCGAKMKRTGLKRGFQAPLVSLIRIAPSTQLRRRPRIALGGAFGNPCAQVLRKLRLARLLRGQLERSQLNYRCGNSLRQQNLLGGPRLRQRADFLFALLQAGEGLLPVLSALRSNAFADCPLLISVLIVLGHESVSVPESLLSSFVP